MKNHYSTPSLQNKHLMSNKRDNLHGSQLGMIRDEEQLLPPIKLKNKYYEDRVENRLYPEHKIKQI